MCSQEDQYSFGPNEKVYRKMNKKILSFYLKKKKKRSLSDLNLSYTNLRYIQIQQLQLPYTFGKLNLKFDGLFDVFPQN